MTQGLPRATYSSFTVPHYLMQASPIMLSLHGAYQPWVRLSISIGASSPRNGGAAAPSFPAFPTRVVPGLYTQGHHCHPTRDHPGLGHIHPQALPLPTPSCCRPTDQGLLRGSQPWSVPQGSGSRPPVTRSKEEPPESLLWPLRLTQWGWAFTTLYTWGQADKAASAESLPCPCPGLQGHTAWHRHEPEAQFVWRPEYPPSCPRTAFPSLQTTTPSQLTLNSRTNPKTKRF